jgi:CheY-like chemotaxis protein/NAD-dependent dihydropyrimidine dehydrogenase PreA subunit
MKGLVIISGKGGIGKTSLTASLAVLADRPVIADCDVDAAGLHLILSPRVSEQHEFRRGHEAIITQADCIGCGACVAYCLSGGVRTNGRVGQRSGRVATVGTSIAPRRSAVAGVEEADSVGAGDAVGGAVDGGEEVEAQAARLKSPAERPYIAYSATCVGGQGRPERGRCLMQEMRHDSQRVEIRSESPVGTVLVVEEDSSDLFQYCALLRRRGCRVCCSCSYAEGEACLDTGLVDFVVVSQGSPAFEGRGVLQRAIEKDRHTPVLVLTRAADMDCYVEAMQLGALDYLEKPVSAGELLKLVATHIRSEN